MNCRCEEGKIKTSTVYFQCKIFTVKVNNKKIKQKSVKISFKKATMIILFKVRVSQIFYFIGFRIIPIKIANFLFIP